MPTLRYGPVPTRKPAPAPAAPRSNPLYLIAMVLIGFGLIGLFAYRAMHP